MNFPTICISWGLARLPLWGRGQQGKNSVAAETGSLRLEFPSCYCPSSETPSGSASPARASSHPASTICPSSLPRPLLLLPGYKHTQHMAAQGSAFWQKPQEEGVTDASWHLA